ncbi:coiled-coil domain-containing protein 42-like isoform 4-T10 [Geothlypis trichas]
MPLSLTMGTSHALCPSILPPLAPPSPALFLPVTPPCSACWGGDATQQMGSEMVLGGSAPSPLLGHSPTSRAIQHPAKELDSVCNLEENNSCRELRATEEDSQSSFMQLFKKRKEVQEMEKVMAEKEEAFRERMKGIADRWRDLHAKRAQLKAHVERSGSTVQKCEELRIQALETDRKQREENIKMAGELLRVKMELETLRKKHCKLCKKVQKYSIFKKYLEDVVEVSQEAHWADIQDRTSKKTGKLWTIKLAIHNLFQSTNLRLQAQRSALECTSCRQLSMIQQFIQDLKDFQLYIKMQKHQRVATTSEDKRDLAA